MPSIRIDYDNTRTNARKLMQAAEVCEDSSRRLTTARNDIPSYWNGVAAETYITALEKWTRESAQLQEDLNSLARQIIRIADEFEEAEQRIKEATESSTIGAAARRIGSGKVHQPKKPNR